MRSWTILVMMSASFLLACTGRIDDVVDNGPKFTAPGGNNGDDPIELDCETCVGSSKLIRLTAVEYERSIRDVLGAGVGDVRFDGLAADGKSGPFSSNADLNVDNQAVEKYRSVADAIAENVAGSLPECDATCADGKITEWGEQLFRRPLTDADRTSLKSVYDVGAQTSASNGIRLLLTALLQSPSFLYRPEGDANSAADEIVVLTPTQLASRLSFFLWKSAPDQTLLDAASDGQLDSTEGIAEQARRMLQDPRADFMIKQFHLQWLGTDHITDRNLVEADFPEFAALRDDMKKEVEDFTVHVFREEVPTTETLLTAPYTFASSELAEFYELPAPDATGKVNLNEQRTGLLTQGAFLAAHGTDPETVAIHRGKMVRERLLCRKLDAPPAVDMVLTPDESLTTREKLELKTGTTDCAVCHRVMNPIGFAFEHFDAAGAWREKDGPHEIDVSGDVPDSDVTGPLNGAVELSARLAGSKLVEACTIRQWFRYSMGRSESLEDEAAIALAFQALAESGGDIREAIIALTISDSFRHRRIPN